MKYYVALSAFLVVGAWFSCASFVTSQKHTMNVSIVSEATAAVPVENPAEVANRHGTSGAIESGIVRVTRVFPPRRAQPTNELQECRQIMDTVATLNQDSYKILNGRPDE